jgi:putative resolvase
MKKANDIEYYTTHQAAKFLLVRPVTIIKWEKNGEIKVVKTLGGHRRIPGTEINRVWSEMNK